MLSLATTYTLFTDSRLVATRVASTPRISLSDTSTSKDSTSIKDSSNISASARQMSEASSHSDSRGNLPQQQLKQRAIDLLKQINGQAYYSNKEIHDREAPKTSDPNLLARAKQATDFLNGKTVNPFQGLSRDQLAFIAYDESGTFTVNERRAASREADAQEYAWRRNITQKALNEYNDTGKLTNFFSETLKRHKGLPEIEQAQYPEDYENKLQNWVDQDLSYRPDPSEGKNLSHISERIMSTLSKQEGGATEPQIVRIDPRAGIKRVTPEPG